MKKLYTLFALVLMLAALIAVPKKVSAASSCPLPGGSAAAYCESLGYQPGTQGFNYCYNSICWPGGPLYPECCN